MKKILLIAVLFCLSNGNAQNQIAKNIQKLQKENTKFTPISVLTADASISRTAVDKAVSDATLAKVDLYKVNQVAAGLYEYIELEIPYQNQNYKIQLYRVDPFAADFKIDTDKNKNIPYQKGVYYRGIINGDLSSVSAFNFFNGEFNGIFSSNEIGNIVVGKLDKPNNQTDYIVYSDAKLKVLNDFECHFKDDDDVTDNVSSMSREVNTDKCVTFYFEIDYNLYLNNNSSTTLTSNWMTSVFNNVQTLFNNDVITTALKSMFIWTSLDPYEGVGTSSSAYLQTFAQSTPVFNGDVGMLVGIDPGGLGGVAYRDSICQSYNYSYSDVNFSYSTVPTYSWTIQVITHEFGHSLGSRHTHACSWNGNNTAIDGCGQQAGYSEGSCPTGPIPTNTTKGTIMSYCHLISGVGISFANGFGFQPAAFMTNTINGKSCISTNCTDTCINTVSDVTVANITETSASITWSDLDPSVTQWQISVTPIDSFTITWITRTTPSYNVSNLLPNTYYKIRIRPICAGLIPKTRDRIFATPANPCTGFVFTDTGGPSANYTNMESFVRTFTPSIPNQKVTVTFTQFQLELDYDYLYIYNGPNTTFPEFNSGIGFTGTNSPGTITSTAADGSLTFRFFSDQELTAPGWNATVSCQQSLGVDSNSFIDFTYYPNPTNSSITLKSNTTITEIDVYNIEGRKLFTKKLEALESNVDLSQFASGTYFFKVRFNEIEKNFKVLKL